MKRLAAIVFLIVVLFNYYGYRLVISCMQLHSEVDLERQVDKNNFNEQDLISIKAKLNLPYYISSAQYERAYGSVSINGINYQYVKRRVYNDTLELLCLPNQTKTKLQSVNNELTRALADGQLTTPKKNVIIKITLPDFFQSFKTFSASCIVQRGETGSEYKASLLKGYFLKHKKPPKAFSLHFC